MYSEGFKYWLAYTKNKISYYRCSRHKLDKCPGRCIVDKGGARSVVAHNHPAEPDRVLVDNFRKVLTKRASTESTNLHNIYWDEARQRHIEAALLYTFTAAESAMRKARQKRLPPVPETPADLSDVLTESSLFKVHSGSVPQPFYQTTLLLESSTCIVFAHLNTLQRINRVEELHVDGSMTISENYYLLTIHTVQADHFTPIVYIVTTERSQSIYAAAFAYVRENYSAYISPTSVVTNFEPNIQGALSLTFPEATIKGFWFEYTMDVLRQMKVLNLERQTTRGHGSCCLRMLMVLPLLPADYITPGLEAVRKWATEKSILSPEMTSLCTYITRNWLRPMGPHKMSVFGMPHAHQNYAHQFNKELNDSLNQANNRTIWKALEILTHIATRTYVRVKKHHRRTESTASNETVDPSSVAMPKELRKNKKFDQVRNEIINDATQQWIRTSVHLRSPLHFLQISSHCINNTVYFGNLDEMELYTSASKPIAPVAPHRALPPKTQCVTIPSTQPPQFSNAGDFNFTSVMSLDHTYSFDTACIYEAPVTSQPEPVVQPSLIALPCIQNDDTQSVTVLGTEVVSAEFEDHPIKQEPNTVRVRSSDPPPLAFFPKVRATVGAPKALIPKSEPPPLVLIGKRKIVARKIPVAK